MKIKSIKKVGPELYHVLFKRWWSKKEIERYVIVDRVYIESLKKEVQLIAYRDSDELAEDCRPHVEWMIRNNVDYFNNYPGNGVSLMVDNRGLKS